MFAAATDATGAPDAKLIEIAADEERIVLTFDKEGTRAASSGLSQPGQSNRLG